MSKLPNPSNKYCVLLVPQYYGHLCLTKKFNLLPAKKDYILYILRSINTKKAAGIDRFPGRFLGVSNNVLANLVTDIFNFQKRPKNTSQIIDLPP